MDRGGGGGRRGGGAAVLYPHSPFGHVARRATWPNGEWGSAGHMAKRRVGVRRVLAVNAGNRAPRGGVTRQGVVLTDLQSLLDCQYNFSLSLSLSLSLST
jgi:hypothetical protein